MKNLIILTLLITIFTIQKTVAQATCETAIIIDLNDLPFTYSGTTEGSGDDYYGGGANSCGFWWTDDFVFEFSSLGDQYINIQLDYPPDVDTNPEIAITKDCPDQPNDITCIAYELDSNPLPGDFIKFETLYLEEPGIYYIIVTNAGWEPAGDELYIDFTLEVFDPLEGSVCENAITVNNLPFTYSGTTEGYGEDYNSSTLDDSGCDPYWWTNDILFEFNALGDEILRFKLFDYLEDHDAEISIIKGCPDDTTSICIITDADTNPEPGDFIEFEVVYLEDPGTYYFIVSSAGWTPAGDPQFIDFSLEVDNALEGAVCSNAIVIEDTPYIYEGTTLGFGDDYGGSAPGCETTDFFLSQRDIVYKYFSEGNTILDIQVSQFSEDDHYAGVFLMDGCPDENTTTCLYSDISITGDELLIENADLQEPGWYYIIVSSALNNPAIDDFTLTICKQLFPELDENVCYILELPDLENYCQTTTFDIRNDYACQYYCIANTTCEEYDQNGENGWASADFMAYVWQSFESMNMGPLYDDDNIVPDWAPFAVEYTVEELCAEIEIKGIPRVMEEYLCFSLDGVFDHYLTEMNPVFFSFCDNCPTANIDDWDNNHNQFLDEAVVPCFVSDIVDMPEFLGCTTGKTTKWLAIVLREMAQSSCEAFQNPNLNIYDLYQEDVTSFLTDFLAGNYCCVADAFQDLPGVNFISPCNIHEIYEVGQEVVENIAGGEWLSFIPGIPLQANRAGEDSNDPIIVNFTDLHPNFYEINNNELTITASTFPFADISPIYNVFSMETENGDTTITLLKQFIITDSDTDGDLLGDTYETNIGLDSNTPNTNSTDQDNDGLSDLLEAAIGSNPLDNDTDDDGFSDYVEFTSVKDFNNPDNFPEMPDTQACDDGVLNGDEIGIDCGGSCPNDCSDIATCSDGIQNGDEEGIDCGGSCSDNCVPEGFTLSITDPCNCLFGIDLDGDDIIDLARETITIYPGASPYITTSIINLFDVTGTSLNPADIDALIAAADPGNGMPFDIVVFVLADGLSFYSLSVSDSEGSSDTIMTPVGCSCDGTAIPALSQWGLITLALLLMILGSLKIGFSSITFKAYRKKH